VIAATEYGVLWETEDNPPRPGAQHTFFQLAPNFPDSHHGTTITYGAVVIRGKRGCGLRGSSPNGQLDRWRSTIPNVEISVADPTVGNLLVWNIIFFLLAFSSGFSFLPLPQSRQSRLLLFVKYFCSQR
jgi:hypothetical protein